MITYVYWIHRPGVDLDPFKSGYIGITSDPVMRENAHWGKIKQNDDRRAPVYNKLEKDNRYIFNIIHKTKDRISSEIIEYIYRPTRNIGLNTSTGGLHNGREYSNEEIRDVCFDNNIPGDIIEHIRQLKEEWEELHQLHLTEKEKQSQINKLKRIRNQYNNDQYEKQVLKSQRDLAKGAREYYREEMLLRGRWKRKKCKKSYEEYRLDLAIKYNRCPPKLRQPTVRYIYKPYKVIIKNNHTRFKIGSFNPIF